MQPGTTASSVASTKYIALLRAINVGGNRKVPMADLRALVAEAGATDVQTYIQSGNVVFEHAQTDDDVLRDDLERRLAGTFGFDVPVILRRAAAWDAVVAGNPFPDAEPTRLLVSFLRDSPPAGALDDVDAVAFAPEQFVLSGREVYLHLPEGFGNAKLPRALQRALNNQETARNWRTVLKLAEMGR